ncbi:MAG: methylmalonyl-CoA mutase family protein, partial [Chitinophagales bacterium]
MEAANKLFENWPAVSKTDWITQMQKDLKGEQFEEKLISEYSGIKVFPAYTAEDLPESTIVDTNAFDDVLEDNADEQSDGQLITWSVCREIFFSGESDIYTLGDPELNHGALCVRVSGDTQSFLRQFRLTMPVANHFVLAVDDDLSDHDSVSIYRNLIANIGGHQLLISAIEFDPIGYWMQSGKMPNKENSFHHLAELYFKLSPILHDCKIIHVDASIAAEAGADMTQQLAYALAIAGQYLEEMDKRNVPLDQLIPLFNFRFSVQSEFFFEIAKLQAF